MRQKCVCKGRGLVKELLWSRASDSAEEAWKIDFENSQTCNAPEQILLKNRGCLGGYKSEKGGKEKPLTNPPSTLTPGSTTYDLSYWAAKEK